MVASSEQHNAPVMVNRPATAHARRSQPGAPLIRDDSADTIKIPDPIIDPITIIVASIGPSARTRLVEGTAGVTIGEVVTPKTFGAGGFPRPSPSLMSVAPMLGEAVLKSQAFQRKLCGGEIVTG